MASAGKLPMPAQARLGVGRAGNIGGGTGVGRATATPPPLNAPQTISGVASEAAADKDPAEPIDQRSVVLTQKLHRSVFAVAQRIKKKEPLTATDEAGFIHNGKAEVQVWLTEKSDAALAKLKELGFEVVLDAKNSKLIVGRIAIDKLEALANLKFVKYVAPQK